MQTQSNGSSSASKSSESESVRQIQRIAGAGAGPDPMGDTSAIPIAIGSDKKQRRKPGILRLDISKPRRSSGDAVEFRTPAQLLAGEDVTSPSGATSPHQLSVTWASQCDINDPESTQKKLASIEKLRSRSLEEKSNHGEWSAGPVVGPTSPIEGSADEHHSDDDDYSVSVSAIMQRRASIRAYKKRGSRRNSRRASSPMENILDANSTSGDRRRSSVYTTSSGETAISVDEETKQESTQEQIFENIRLHKEVIQSVKFQPWSMRKKLKLVRQAKTYVARHQGALQERFAMSRSTRDLWARFKILMAARWTHWKREISSILTVLIPWELRIKEIESHFGSGVASYFIFLRWLLWVNIMMAIPLVAFVIAPEFISTNPNEEDPRKRMTEREQRIAGNILTYWEFEGNLKYSPLFYGYYSNKSGASRNGYNLPMAYFLTAVVVYIYSFVATLRKMAENSRTSKLSSKDDECIFSWKLFTGWDFMIGHAETAHNRIASVVVGFKEALLEEAEKKKDKRNWRIILQRILVNILITGLLAASGYTVVSAVDRSETIDSNASWYRRNEVNIIMTLLSFFLPMFFDALGLFENWHPRQQLRLQLARIMILNLLNLYSLMFSCLYKITEKDESLQKLKEVDKNAHIELESLQSIIGKITASAMLGASTQITTSGTTTNIVNAINRTRCFRIPVNCTSRTLTTSLMLLSLGTTILPSTVWNATTTIREATTDFRDFETTEFSTTEYFAPSSTDVPSTTLDYDLTTPQMSTTTTEDYEDTLPMNNSYFEYYDYFENFDEPSPEVPKGSSRRLSRPIREIPENETTSTDDWISTSTTYEPSSESSSSESSSSSTSEDTESSSSSTEQQATKPAYGGTESDQPQQEPSNTTPSQSSTSSDDYDYEDDSGNCTKLVCVPVALDATEFSKSVEVTSTNAPLPVSDMPMYVDKMRNVENVIEMVRKNLTSMCWETSLGQELSKVIVFDTIMSITATLIIDFLRALFVRYMNEHWCWDMEKTFPQYGDFKIAESILNLVHNQGQVWMGIFFSPGLVVVNLVKLIILMYLRSWIVLTCNVPHEVVFKASKSNNFYLALLLTMLFLCVLPVGYAIVWIRPSWHCGPFSDFNRISEFFTNTTRNALPPELHKPLEYLTSSSTVIPLLLLLILIIYYLVSLNGALREANQDFRTQLQKEREEERKKMFKIPENKSTEPALTTRWRKVLEASSPVTPPGPDNQPPDFDESKVQARNELLARIMKKALRKGSATSEEDSMYRHGNNEDDTDTEHHDSLPHDEEAKERIFRISKFAGPNRGGRRPSIVDVVQRAKQENLKDTHPKSRFKVNKSGSSNENDPEVNSRIVSERRQSLLRKQAKLTESSPPKPSNDPNLNYEVVNEINADAEKKKKKSTRPEKFKFDKVVTEAQKVEVAEVSPPMPPPAPTQFCDDSPTEKPPSERMASLSKQGRKKIGSFLALVREAAKAKRMEGGGIATSPPSTETSPEEIETSTEKEENEDPGPIQDYAARGRSGSQCKRPTTMRQDSQTSVWSDNIPTITISKTGSQECILETNTSKEGKAAGGSKEKKKTGEEKCI